MLWREHIESGHLELCPPLYTFVSENNVFSVKSLICIHFKNWEVGFF